MVDLLFVRPADDQAAQLIATVGGKLVRLVQTGFAGIGPWSVTDLVGSANVDRNNIDSELKNGVNHLFYFGHGTYDELVAAGSALIDAKNIALLPPSAIVVAVACYSRETLGQMSVASGSVSAYLGWEDELLIPQLHPAPMLDAIAAGLMTLLLGGDIASTKQSLRNEFSLALAAYRAWNPPPNAGNGAKRFAKSSAAFASVCLDFEGLPSATL